MWSGQEDSFLMDSAMGTEALAACPPKPRPEESVEPKPPKRRSKNKLRNSMAWDKAFLVDDVLLHDPDLDFPLVPEAPIPPLLSHPLLPEVLTPPRSTHRPAAISVPPKKSLSESGSRPPSRARTPDLSPFTELQSNTPIPSASPSPAVLQWSGGKQGREPVQEGMTLNGNFLQENEGALGVDDLPLAESPVPLTRKKSVEQNSALLESSDSCVAGGSYSRPQRCRVSRSSMAWDGAFQSNEGLLDLNLADNSSAAQTPRAFDPISGDSVPFSTESSRMESSSSLTAESNSGDDGDTESSKGGLVGRVRDSANGGQGTPTQGRRRQKPASLHRSSSTTVTIEAAIKDGTRLRLPGRYNPTPAPLSKPTTPTKSATPAKTPSMTPIKSVSRPETPKAVPPSKPRSGSSSHQSSPRPQASKGKATGVKQGLDLRSSSELEALQAQLAAISAERDALAAKVSVLEGSTVLENSTVSNGGALKRPNEVGRFTERSGSKAQTAVPKPTAVPAGSGRPTALPAGSAARGASQPMTSALPKLPTSKKDSATTPAPERQQPITSVLPSAATSRPSFLKQPTAKNDFFQTPTSSAPAKAVSTEAAAGPSSASRGVAGGVRSAAGSIRVSPSAQTRASKLPVATRTHSQKAAPVPAPPKASRIPQAAQNHQTSRYQSLLRKPAARGVSGSPKSGTFNASAIRSACAVPLPASPIGTDGLASPLASPATKPVSRVQAGTSNLPGPSPLRRSNDKGPFAVSNPANAASGGAKNATQAGSTFMSRLTAVSGSQTKIPLAGLSGLKPPGQKVPGVTTQDVTVTSAKLAALDPAIIVAACAVPLPESLEGLEVWSSNQVLPRGVLSTADQDPSADVAVSQSLKPQTLKPRQPRVSFLRPPSTVTSALINAACRVALPLDNSLETAPSPKNSEEVLDGRCGLVAEPQLVSTGQKVCSKGQGGVVLDGGDFASGVSASGSENEAKAVAESSGTMVAADEVGPRLQPVAEETNSLTHGGESHPSCRSTKSALGSSGQMQSVINASARKEESPSPGPAVDSPVEEHRGITESAQTKKETPASPDPVESPVEEDRGAGSGEKNPVDSAVEEHHGITETAQKEQNPASSDPLDSPVEENRGAGSGGKNPVDSPVEEHIGITESAQKKEKPASSDPIDSPVEDEREAVIMKTNPVNSPVREHLRGEVSGRKNPVDSPVEEHRKVTESAQKEQSFGSREPIDGPVDEYWKAVVERRNSVDGLVEGHRVVMSGEKKPVDSPVGENRRAASGRKSPVEGSWGVGSGEKNPVDSPVEENRGAASGRKNLVNRPLEDSWGVTCGRKNPLNSPVEENRGAVSGIKKQAGLSLPDLTVSWEDNEFEMRIRALEAEGETAMSSKSGPVQASPPDKGSDGTPVNPYSPVRKRERGPFDCTKRA